jgi:ferredoxin
MTKFKLEVNKETCIGCGNCAAVCPGSFEIKDGKAAAKRDVESVTCEDEAAKSCPVEAITIKKVE